MTVSIRFSATRDEMSVREAPPGVVAVVDGVVGARERVVAEAEAVADLVEEVLVEARRRRSLPENPSTDTTSRSLPLYRTRAIVHHMFAALIQLQTGKKLLLLTRNWRHTAIWRLACIA